MSKCTRSHFLSFVLSFAGILQSHSKTSRHKSGTSTANAIHTVGIAFFYPCMKSDVESIEMLFKDRTFNESWGSHSVISFQGVHCRLQESSLMSNLVTGELPLRTSKYTLCGKWNPNSWFRQVDGDMKHMSSHQ